MCILFFIVKQLSYNFQAIHPGYNNHSFVCIREVSSAVLWNRISFLFMWIGHYSRVNSLPEFFPTHVLDLFNRETRCAEMRLERCTQLYNNIINRHTINNTAPFKMSTVHSLTLHYIIKIFNRSGDWLESISCIFVCEIVCTGLQRKG